MTFEDLPADWPTRPVTDPQITADLLDLVVRERDRDEGALAVLICGPGRRLAQPVVLSSPPRGAPLAERRAILDVLCRAVADGGPEGSGGAPGGAPGAGILLAVARTGHRFGTVEDCRWRDAAEQSCATFDIEMLGTWVVTPSLIRQLPSSVPVRRRSA